MQFALENNAKGIDEDNAKGIIPTMDAQLIRKARELTGESQGAFGARFGVDQTTIHRWETNGAPKHGPGRMALQREVDAILEAQRPGRAVKS